MEDDNITIFTEIDEEKSLKVIRFLEYLQSSSPQQPIKKPKNCFYNLLNIILKHFK